MAFLNNTNRDKQTEKLNFNSSIGVSKDLKRDFEDACAELSTPGNNIKPNKKILEFIKIAINLKPDESLTNFLTKNYIVPYIEEWKIKKEKDDKKRKK